MAVQKVIVADETYTELSDYLSGHAVRSIFLVCGKSMSGLKIGKYFEELPERMGIKVIKFSDFAPNPKYESIVRGVERFRTDRCDLIAAVGGGSAMDVAKCIKLYADMKGSENYLKQKVVPNDIPLLAVPTTAGTGSEATRFAVIYYNKEKQSVAHESCLPSVVLMDAGALDTLPEYQRKATMLDALCHAIESFWSVNATAESKEYAREAIRLALASMDGYLKNTGEGNSGMLKAAYVAGKAINITKTTAGHAMCYKLTTLYGISHGHAAALCVAGIWPYMLEHMEDCIDARGQGYLRETMESLAEIFGYSEPGDAASWFQGLLKELELQAPAAEEKDFEILKHSVNPDRLKNHPVRLDVETIDRLYHGILRSKEGKEQ